MRWGRRWGSYLLIPNDNKSKTPTYWGGEGAERRSGRQEVRIVRGRIIPCESCKRNYRCEMFKSATRHRMRHGEYGQGTNVIHMCDIYTPDRIPQNIKMPQIHGRTSGKVPT